MAARRTSPVEQQQDRARNADLINHLEHDEPVQAVMPLGPDDLRAIARATGYTIDAVKALVKVHEEGGWTEASGLTVQAARRAMAAGAERPNPAMLKARAQAALGEVQTAIGRIIKGKLPFSPTDRAIAEHVAGQHIPAPESPMVAARRAASGGEASPDALRKRAERAQARRDAEIEAKQKGEKFVDDLNADRVSIAGQQAREVPLSDTSPILGNKAPGGRWPFDEKAVQEILETPPGSAARRAKLREFNPNTKVFPPEGTKQ